MTTYYVNNSSVNASDSNAGTDPNAPLLSLDAVSKLALQPGDTVCFQAGTTYAGSGASGAALTISASGTAANPITFTSYGTGAPPVIENLSTSMYSDAIQTVGASYININSLSVTNAARAGVNIDAASSNVTVQNMNLTNVGEGVLVNGQNNLITQNSIHDLHLVYNPPVSVSATGGYGANGVVIGGSNNAISYNRIQNASAASYDFGTDGGGFEVYGNVSNVTINDNIVQNSDGFFEAGSSNLGTINNVSLSNNISLNNGTFITLHNAGGAFGSNVTNFVAQNNTIINQFNTSTAPSTVMLDGPATTGSFNFTNNFVSLNDGDSVFKQNGDYHSNNTYYLAASDTHLYNNWNNTLGAGESYGTAAAANNVLASVLSGSPSVGQSAGAQLSATDLALVPAAVASAVTNAAPIVTGSTTSVAHGTMLQMSSLFTPVDPNGYPITQYQVVDKNTTPSGQLMLGGVAVADGQVINLSADQLSSLQFLVGFGADALQVSAYDGQAWSGWSAVNVTGTNNPPTVAVSNLTVSHGTNLAASSLMQYSDPDGDPAVTYQVLDTGVTTSGGHFVLNGVAEANGQTINVSAAQLAGLSFQTGLGIDYLQVRAFDGGAWSNWGSFTVNAVNSAPVVAASNKTVAHGSVMAASALFAATDADGDPITEYQFIDQTSAADSGHFTVNGTAQAAGQTIDVTAAQLAQMNWVAGSGSDTIQVRAFDGLAWGNWASMTVTAPVNNAPVVTASPLSVVHGTSLAAASLMSVTDAEKDAITQYQFIDLNTAANAGTFLLNGVAVANGQTIQVTAAQLAGLTYQSGTSSDSLQIRAFDGLDWSAWKTTSVTGLERAPVVAAANTTLAHGATVAAASLFTATDPDGDPVVEYQLADLSGAADSGAFVLNGIRQGQTQVVDVTAAQLAGLNFQAGSGTDQVRVRAYDGLQWGAWTTFGVTAPIDATPVVTGSVQSVTRGTILQASALFSVTDAERDAMTQYQVIDNTTSASSGGFVLNGVALTAGQTIGVTAAQMAQLTFQTALATDALQVRAFDGLEWSAWAKITVTGVDHAPVAAALNVTVAHGATVAASTLLSVSDPDGDPITEYQLADTNTAAGAGYFVLNGIVQAAGAMVDVTAAQLSQLSYVAGSGTDQIKVRASDGTLWGAWTVETATAPVDSAPVVTATQRSIAKGASVNARTLFTAADAENDSITKYQIVNYTTTATSGYFVVNGVAVAPNQAVTLTAAQLAQTTFVAGTTNNSIAVRAFDGTLWGNMVTMSIVPSAVTPAVSLASANVQLPMADSAPVVSITAPPVAPRHGTSLALNTLFSVSDVDQDITQSYQVVETAPGNGYLTVNGVAQTAGQTVTITAAQLAQTNFVAGAGPDSIQVRASDGMLWSNWQTITVTPAFNNPPVVTANSQPVAHGASAAVTSLFSAMDPDGDTLTDYQIMDLGTASDHGTLLIGGVAQSANTIIDMNASQLATAQFQSGSGSDALQFRAYDGAAWSSWQTATVTAPIDSAPVITPAPTTLNIGAQIAASALFSASDAENDTITQFQLVDNSTAAGAGCWIVNGSAVAAGTIVTVTASQLANVLYQNGSAPDLLSVRAFDGLDWGNWTSLVTKTNHPPVVTATSETVAHGASVAVTSLFSAMDPDGDTLTDYQIMDLGTACDHGTLVVGGVAQSSNTIIDLTADQLATAQFQSGSGSDALQFRAYDGAAWSSWQTATVAAPINNAPVVTPSATTLAIGAQIAASALFSVSDAENDTISAYQLVDNSTAAGSGSWMVNGSAVAAGTIVTVTASQLANVLYQNGSGSDVLSVRAFDGLDWGNWTPLVTKTNHPPVVTANSQQIAHGASVAVTSLFSAMDPDGDTLTDYQVMDLGTASDHGTLTVGGVAQSSNTIIDLTANQLATAQFQSGSGSDALQFRAYDGAAWSSWQTATVTAPIDSAPVITPSPTTLAIGAQIAASALFSVSDAENDTISAYQLVDNSSAAGSGYWMVNGSAVAAGTIVTVTASQLANVLYQNGSGSDLLSVRAFDGLDWGNWTSLVSNTNHPPVVTANSEQVAHGAAVAVTSLFSAMDPDGDTLTDYQIMDLGTASDHGTLMIGGVAQASNTIIDMNATQLATALFQSGSGSDCLQFRAYDGAAWSSWQSATVAAPIDSAPVVSATPATLNPGATIAASALFSVKDAENDAIPEFQLVDNSTAASSGHLVLNGSAVAAGTIVDVTASQLANVLYQNGSAADLLSVRAFDGLDWGNWTALATQTNQAPIILASNQSFTHGSVVAASSMFSVQDPNGKSMTRYQLIDSSANANSGNFVLNGQALAANQTIDLTASQFAALNYQAGTTVSDYLQLRVFNGTVWSSWAHFNATPTDAAPTIVASGQSVAAQTSVAAASLFAVSDSDHDPITQYQLIDYSTGANAGHFSVNGAAQSAAQTINLTPAQFAATMFTAGTSLHDSISLRASDGILWSSWTPSHT